MNGVRLSGSEFTAINGTSIILSNGASLGDVIDIIGYSGGALSSQGLQGIQGISVQGTTGLQGTTGNQGAQGTTGTSPTLTLRSNGTISGTNIDNINFLGASITSVGSASTITVAGELDITSSLFI